LKRHPERNSISATNEIGLANDVQDGKRAWQAPKLEFVKPVLTERGPVKDLTGGFFGTFSP